MKRTTTAMAEETWMHSVPDAISIQWLPDEVLAKIFGYLRIEDLAFGAQHVCRRWANVSRASEVWKNRTFAPSPGSSLGRIISVIEQSPMLQGLYISRFIPVHYMRAIFKSVVFSVRSIKFLALPANSNICSPIREIIPEMRHSLECLEIQFCDSFPFDVLQEYYSDILTRVGMCSNLKTLILTGVMICHQSAFEAIANGCVRLKTLNIKKCEMYEPYALECLLKRKVDSIVTLSLPWNILNDEGTLTLVAKYCKKIEKLCVVIPSTLFGVIVTYHDLVAFRDMPYLSELSLPSLKHDVLGDFLELFGSNVFQNLVKLDLRHNTWMKNVLFETITKKCPKLRYLNIQFCYELTSPAFQTIYLLKSLQYLNLEGCAGLRNEVMEHIVKCKMLRYLNVKHTVVFSRSSLMLCCENLKFLEELHMQVTCVSDEDTLVIPNRLQKYFPLLK